ncbi:MAG TPA: hypothetical protein VHM20_00865 [Gammaproteobacteria bacterium]|nr:hypothetical protein [Gammaproteobacteria bacterium]
MDNLLIILEELAKNTECTIDLNKLLKDQPLKIKTAFLNEKADQIKKEFSLMTQPDRNKVVKIWSS